MDSISKHRLRGLQLGQAMNWVDRLRTSADEWLLCCRDGVMLVVVVLRLPIVSRRTDLVERRRHYHFEVYAFICVYACICIWMRKSVYDIV